MTVAEINALLYSPNHARDRLERALRIEALSPGWRASFEALLQRQTTAAGSGNAGLAPAAAAHPVAPGFQPLVVTAIDQEFTDVLSLTMQSPDGQPLRPALPGQYVVLRLQRTGGGPPLFRSYSLSGPLSMERYRISVKIEPDGASTGRRRRWIPDRSPPPRAAEILVQPDARLPPEQGRHCHSRRQSSDSAAMPQTTSAIQATAPRSAGRAPIDRAHGWVNTEAH